MAQRLRGCRIVKNGFRIVLNSYTINNDEHLKHVLTFVSPPSSLLISHTNVQCYCLKEILYYLFMCKVCVCARMLCKWRPEGR